MAVNLQDMSHAVTRFENEMSELMGSRQIPYYVFLKVKGHATMMRAFLLALSDYGCEPEDYDFPGAPDGTLKTREARQRRIVFAQRVADKEGISFTPCSPAEGAD